MDCVWHAVRDHGEAEELFLLGGANRSFYAAGGTGLSRSHTFVFLRFSKHVKQSGQWTEDVRGKLLFADLAPSDLQYEFGGPTFFSSALEARQDTVASTSRSTACVLLSECLRGTAAMTLLCCVSPADMSNIATANALETCELASQIHTNVKPLDSISSTVAKLKADEERMRKRQGEVPGSRV